MFYEKVFRALQDRGVRYVLIGGAAVNLHGVPRMTGDLDLAVDMGPDNVSALVGALVDAGLEPSAPVDPMGLADEQVRREWRETKHLEALTFQSRGGKSPYAEVDIILNPLLDFGQLYKDRENVEAGGLILSLISIKQLIEIKRRLGREQDLSDAEALEKISSEGDTEG